MSDSGSYAARQLKAQVVEVGDGQDDCDEGCSSSVVVSDSEISRVITAQIASPDDPKAMLELTSTLATFLRQFDPEMDTGMISFGSNSFSGIRHIIIDLKETVG
jgi:hypothetical protein